MPDHLKETARNLEVPSTLIIVQASTQKKNLRFISIKHHIWQVWNLRWDSTEDKIEERQEDPRFQSWTSVNLPKDTMSLRYERFMKDKGPTTKEKIPNRSSNL
ncbi:hypothetical protein AVEN_181394-1 [Araneus ventricosus]|uniref:Uncharacterized protein n=1 Tax=Araneus ventricosus TaxID=182803 RepID=A0A4Y2Q433_ARAVE|nr:hypothetical protein AVEN_181394-1 [Araneus ventricosus]